MGGCGCGWVWQEGGGLSLRLESGDPGETDMTVPTSLLIAAGRSNNTPPPPLPLPPSRSPSLHLALRCVGVARACVVVCGRRRWWWCLWWRVVAVCLVRDEGLSLAESLVVVVCLWGDGV